MKEGASDVAMAYYDIKVADFGLSKHVEDGSVARTQVGTPQYWAPEVLKEHLSQ